MAWFLVIVAGVFEMGFAVLLKQSHGITRIWPTVGFVHCALSDDGLELDEALLTGEAKPVRKEPGDAVMSGRFVVAGTGRIRAVGVGADAYAARLQAQARQFSLIRSELQKGTNQILQLVTWVMVPPGCS
jgi:hypothetical protein